MAKARRKRIREPYRLLLLREDTLAEVGSYRLSLLNIYIAVSALLIVTSAIVVSVIFFTPVRRLVPGYADVYESREYRDLNQKVLDLEQEMHSQRLYIARFRSLLAGIPSSDTLFGSVLQDPATPESPVARRESGLAARAPAISPDLQSAGVVVSEVSSSRFLHVVPPVRGKVSAQYNPHENHYGTDILAPENTPIVAILDGTVITSDWTLETGHTIGIQHAGNVVSFYKHNSRNLKKLGAQVKAGEAVAIIGNTGEVTSGPHLHFELWIDGKPVDAEKFVNF